MHKYTIPFNVPACFGNEIDSIQDAIERKQFSGNGYYTRLCEQKINEVTGTINTLLTSSCTHALEICALLINIKPDDEVIMSTFNFVSAANAFVLRGAKIVFVDIRPDTFNIDEQKIEEAITSKTKAILAMHYAGVPCNMDIIMEIANKYNIIVIEDAAHCIGAYYKSKHLGTIGHLGTLSFHSTKNIHCGEGGALLINDFEFIERAKIIRDKGTNRHKFLLGQVDKYTWVDIGSSYFMNEITAAFLIVQLQKIDTVNKKRLEISNFFQNNLKEREFIKPRFLGNGHIYYIVFSHAKKRNETISKLSSEGIIAHFHYSCLHTSKIGRKHLSKNIQNAVNLSERLLRLPLFYDLSEECINRIINAKAFS